MFCLFFVEQMKKISVFLATGYSELKSSFFPNLKSYHLISSPLRHISLISLHSFQNKWNQLYIPPIMDKESSNTTRSFFLVSVISICSTVLNEVPMQSKVSLQDYKSTVMSILRVLPRIQGVLAQPTGKVFTEIVSILLPYTLSRPYSTNRTMVGLVENLAKLQQYGLTETISYVTDQHYSLVEQKLIQ